MSDTEASYHRLRNYLKSQRAIIRGVYAGCDPQRAPHIETLDGLLNDLTLLRGATQSGQTEQVAPQERED